MKYTLHTLMALIFAVGLIACDNIIIPEDGNGDPGNGGTGGPADTTETGNGEDADSNFVISLSGSIVDARGSLGEAPAGSSVVISWAGVQGTTFIFGQGTLSEDRRTWSIDLTLPELPEEGFFSPFGQSENLFGIGTPVIIDGEFADGTILQRQPEYLGFLNGGTQIVYNSGNTPSGPGESWLDAFPVGYSLGTAGFNGWVPLEQEQYFFILRR